MGAPSLFLRNLSLRRIIPARPPPSTVAPLPEISRFDEELTAELAALNGGAGMVRFLDASIATQKISLKNLTKITHRDDSDRESIENYLDCNVEILDFCNHFVDKIEVVKKYLDSLRAVVRFFDGRNFSSRMRAMECVESLRGIERKCKTMSKRSGLRRMIIKQKLGHEKEESEISEIMCGSKFMAILACEYLECGLSFESKHRNNNNNIIGKSGLMNCCWMRCLKGFLVSEKVEKRGCDLKEVVRLVRDLEEVMKGKREREIDCVVEGLRKMCRGLEDEIEIVEERVKDLYKCLIDVRMVLLGILSHS